MVHQACPRDWFCGDCVKKSAARTSKKGTSAKPRANAGMQDENAEPRKRKAECSEEDDPEAFCCPITLELMSHPVFLLEVKWTLLRWHARECPISGVHRVSAHV